MKKVRFLFGVGVVLLSLGFSAVGQIPTIQRQAFLSGLSSPVYITNAGDGTNRLFVVQQRGLIKVVQPGQTTTTDFINLASKVSQSGSERGLLGLAFHPDFENNSFFFVNYTRQSDGATVIERYKATNNNTTGDINSGFPIITISQDFSNHNGGQIAFGPDGHLYIGMGDGGSGNDPNNRAQNVNSLLGKMLRITPSLSEIVGVPAYTNPLDNPFVGINGADEIYATGLRNPYRWSFDRGGDHKLWAADVGQNSIEEVDIITKGGNYGWRVYEGNSCTNNDPGLCNPNNFIPPVFQYNHTGGRCSVTGGYVYRGTQGTLPHGAYIYGDYCSGEYWMWNGSSQILIEDTPRNISGFGEDEAGELYLVNLGGTVEKIVNTQPFANDVSADFDGDDKTDLSYFRPSDGGWYVTNSNNGSVSHYQFGSNGDIPTPEDFDGDGRADYAVFRPSTGVWYYVRSGDNTVGLIQFGSNGDIPTQGDFDGDNRSEIAVFRPSNGVWYVAKSSGGIDYFQFGSNGDIPTQSDFDGDGRVDYAVFRPSTGVWYYFRSSNSSVGIIQFGSNGDIPTPGDFDGDNKSDLAVFRPSTGIWYVYNSSDLRVQTYQWGSNGDIPVVGDYDGDGTEDFAVFRPSNGVWYIAKSGGGFIITPFGANGDNPAPKFDTP